MSGASAKPGADERLRASPNFALAFAMDGRPYVSMEVEPYAQFWLSERERILLSLFSGRRGDTVEGAVAAYLRLVEGVEAARERPRLLRAIGEMARSGVLVRPGDDTSRYDARMAADYLTHRPFPPELAELIAKDGRLGPQTRALDLAGGPGSLALALAERSAQVTLMDLSRGFIQGARREAIRRGLALEAINESCNRLLFHDGQYELITISQALHWLDDVLVCRGVGRVLRPGGGFFVILSAMQVADDHPLSFILGDRSILGAKTAEPFEAQARVLLRRLALLFEALVPPNSPAGPIVPAGLKLFRQTRPYGVGYARAFMSPRHIELTGQDGAAFWPDVEARCAAAPAQARLGIQDWAVLEFRRGGGRWAPPAEGGLPVTEIGWSGPTDG